MNLFSYIRTKHNLILKLGIVFITSVFVTFLLPKGNVEVKQVGKFNPIWDANDLVVEDDFLILKSPQEIAEEKKILETDCPLIFEEITSEKDLKLKEFETLKKSNKKLYDVLKPAIDSIYKIGIIESLDSNLLAKKTCLLQYGNYAENITYSNFFTLKSALMFIESRLTHLRYQTVNPLAFSQYLAISVFYSPQKTMFYKNLKSSQISVYKTSLKKGEVLVKNGDQLTNAKRLLINNYFEDQNKKSQKGYLYAFSKFGLVSIILLVLLVFLAVFRQTIFGQNKQVFFLYLVINLMCLATYIFYNYGLMVLSLPFALVPVIIRVFFDSRTALFTHLMTILLCSFFMTDKLEFILLQLISGIGTLFAIVEMRKRQQIANAGLLVLVFYTLVFICYQSSFGTPKLITKLSAYLPFLISAVLVLLSYPIIYVTEKIFGFISDFKLLELCDLNQPLLRRLSQEVPGTFQHSLQVANLAEEAVFYIGGNTLLVRTGAMYHDIGKLFNPTFFTENQGNGYSPHQEMQPLESAKIIISHVIKGIELAKKNKLPDQVIDFIRTHHGTTTVSYFYSLYKKNNGNAESETEFKYKGPIPFSKETAVLMLADGVEAASRSLKVHDAVTISELVDSIIDYKISHNQLINSDITFKDITAIKKIFKKRLMTINHARIEYPAS